MSWLPVIGNVISGLFGQEEGEDNRTLQREVNAANAEATERANLRNIELSRELQSRNEALSRETALRNEAMQREFAQMGIQWRVQDAKAAGLHPLYALGGGGAAFTPNPQLVHGSAPTVQAAHAEAGPPSTWMSQFGQDLGRSLVAALDPVQKAERALQLQLLESQVAKESAQAAYYRSMALREGSGGTGGLPPMVQIQAGTPPEPLNVIDLPYLKDTIRATPSEVESSRSSDSSVTPGERPMWSDYNAFGTTVRLPSKGSTEALESLEPLGAIATVAENVRYHRLLDGAFRFLESAGRRLSSFRSPWSRWPGGASRNYSPHRGGKFN